MYILVLTRRKYLLITVISIILVLAYALVGIIRHTLPETEIVIARRVSLILPHSTKMSDIYMSSKESSPIIETGLRFEDKWKTATIQQYDMSEITFQYPDALRLDEIINLGQEIRIHMNFHHTNNKVHGFFQVWKLDRNLEEFLNESKKYSSMTFINFSESAIKVQELNGFMWEYVFMDTKNDIKGFEVFLENGNEMYRFSMFVLSTDYKPQYKRIFKRMYKSLRIKKAAILPDLSFVGFESHREHAMRTKY
ncbi:MAG TPA: hypothetical protein DCE11_02475 [Ruminiclostridium sp.]|jgi:hypothetical protein|nr:hypothetical protein [Clostridiaceae bacterium]HAA24976.1 hypothetical protein [Ruminiclostridium sp.]